MSSWSQWLLARSNAKFGALTLFALLCCSLVLAWSPIEFSMGERAEAPATVYFWLPASVKGSAVFFTLVRIGLTISTLLWMFYRAIPWSGWATVILFTLMWSLRMENLTNGAHIFNIANWLLLIHAAWFHFYRTEIKAAVKRGEFKTTTFYPRWVLFLCLFYIGWFHFLAGFTKIWHSGFDWGNGVSLQLWVDLFGWEPSPFSQVIQFDSRLTAFMQTGAMLIECACILVIFNRKLRYLIGVALLGFYLGVLTSFIDFGFHANAVLVTLFLLPFDQWMGVKFDGDPATESARASQEEVSAGNS